LATLDSLSPKALILSSPQGLPASSALSSSLRSLPSVATSDCCRHQGSFSGRVQFDKSLAYLPVYVTSSLPQPCCSSLWASPPPFFSYIVRVDIDTFFYATRKWGTGWRVNATGSVLPVCAWDTCELRYWIKVSIYCPLVSANGELIFTFGCPSATRESHFTSIPFLQHVVFLALDWGIYIRSLLMLSSPKSQWRKRDVLTGGKRVSWGWWLTLWSCLYLPVGRCWENRLFLPPDTCCGCGYSFQTTNWQACYIDLFTLFCDKNDRVPWIIQSYMNRFAVLTVWPFSFDHCWFFHLQEGIKKSC